MSQFSTMTTRERKMQAAAICKEFQAQEDIEMDLGKKMSVPQDIMLEELSLASNRGSRLFKMRQRRSEKYTFENIQNQNNKLLNNSVVSQTESGNPMVSHSDKNNSGDNQPSKVPSDKVPSGKVASNTADTGIVPNPDSIAPGYGGPLKDVPPEKFNSTAIPKSYFSPWEQAINSDPALAGTITPTVAEPEPQPHLPGYKSFNRVAIPFGGFSKAPPPVPAKPSQVEALPDFPDLRAESKVSRPTFNRSAMGWLSTSDAAPAPLPAIPLQPVPLPESDDL